MFTNLFITLPSKFCAMAKSLRIIPARLASRAQRRRCFVLMDARDSSVTFSNSLFKKLQLLYGEADEPRVFVFYIPSSRCYGFMVNPAIGTPTQMGCVQYNSKHRCIGFESLNPTVARMFYEYGVSDFQRPCKLSVSRQTTKSGQPYFRIERPRARRRISHR